MKVKICLQLAVRKDLTAFLTTNNLLKRFISNTEPYQIKKIEKDPSAYFLDIIFDMPITIKIDNLKDAFDWTETPEKYEFWNKVNNAFINGTELNKIELLSSLFDLSDN